MRLVPAQTTNVATFLVAWRGDIVVPFVDGSHYKACLFRDHFAVVHHLEGFESSSRRRVTAA